MTVVLCESHPKMLRPMFATPILSIAGMKMRRTMGCKVITFLGQV